MADQQLEDRIEELLRISRGLVTAVEGVRSDVSELKSDVSELKSDVSGLKSDVSELKMEMKATNRKLDTLSGQFNDVANMVIENNGRLTKVEFDVAEIKSNVH
jgi:chromosome segregation ATPase